MFLVHINYYYDSYKMMIFLNSIMPSTLARWHAAIKIFPSHIIYLFIYLLASVFLSLFIVMLKLSPIWPVKAPSGFLLCHVTCPQCLNASLISGTRCSKLILYFLSLPYNQPFIQLQRALVFSYCLILKYKWIGKDYQYLNKDSNMKEKTKTKGREGFRGSRQSREEKKF